MYLKVFAFLAALNSLAAENLVMDREVVVEEKMEAEEEETKMLLGGELLMMP